MGRPAPVTNGVGIVGAAGPVSTAVTGSTRAAPVEVERVTIRFAGDSGDGVQLTGAEFSKAVGTAGSDFTTNPDYPSEIRAPSGTLFGVSAYQIQYASKPVFTSGDAPDVLVAMNPAALKVNLPDLKPGGMLIVNSGAFTDGNLVKAGYSANPLEDGGLSAYRIHPINITELTAVALRDSGLAKRRLDAARTTSPLD